MSLRVLTTASALSRRTAIPSIQRHASTRASFVSSKSAQTAALIFTAILGGSYLATSFTSNADKRKAALQKLDTSRAARQAPAVVTTKAEESQETIPPDSQQEDAQEAAYDPVTGEINWDCPCLGGMAQGPCGEEFKAAFSCFVHSTEDPKGVDCIEQFKAMQDCFRRHPEHYADEIAEDDDDPSAPTDLSEGSTSNISDSIFEAASSAKESLSNATSSVESVASSAVSSVSSLVSSDSQDSHKMVQKGSTQKAYSEHDTPTYGKGADGSKSESGKIRNQGTTQNSYVDHDKVAGHSSASVSGKDSLHPEKTPNQTAGSAEPLGRNAAKGSRPSGSSETAHAKHLEGVKATRTGEDAVGSRNPGMRG